MGRLAGKMALVTGGAAGIGAAAAELFAREGARVAILDIDAKRGARLCQCMAAAGATVHFLEADGTDEAAVKAAVLEGVERLGGLNILLNCTGGSAVDDSFVTDVDLDLWHSTMDRNVLSTILASRFAIPEIVRGGGGSVVNMSSGAALRGASPKHIYTASKGAIVALTRAMASAYVQENVRVNAICAGRILTERILSTVGKPGNDGPVADRQDATGRVRDYPFWVGSPDDIARIALFLASDESRMITGASIPADGGRSAY